MKLIDKTLQFLRSIDLIQFNKSFNMIYKINKYIMSDLKNKLKNGNNIQIQDQ